MSCGAAQGRENSPAVGNLESELPMEGFAPAYLLSWFVKSDGSQMDLEMRLSPEFDLKSELLSGRVKAFTKLTALSSAIPERENVRRASTIITRSNLSGIIKLGLRATGQRLVSRLF